MPETILEAGATALAERPDLSAHEDEFTLDVRVVVGVAPIGHVACNTDDNCGNTCAGSASSCNSFTDDPS
jgi:FxLD family lantipeptide